MMNCANCGAAVRLGDRCAYCGTDSRWLQPAPDDEWLEITCYEDSTRVWLNTRTGERRRGELPS